ncbi:hypothetical protein J7E25_09630 [Agromyces sp. ISL-38]|uniref:hypothetical protein n=1 Tax=Agromyces sp. ISL-38 TaxID=2819107 RepID=UPI001BE5D8AA|nr:hypothetical protein [Agromyces sp. ISL-38]MBT2499359.1 hypothetical protein [Agromyces sp. ISL-38]
MLLVPIIAFEITRRVCLGLQRKDRDLVLHGFETGRIVRLPGGEYVEVHRPISDDERLPPGQRMPPVSGCRRSRMP